MKRQKIKNYHNLKPKKASLINVFIFILIITLAGFGGGNALMPIIKKYSVDKYKWLDNKEFDDVVITSNLIPGPSVVETLSYIAIKLLGKTKGVFVTLLGILPSALLALGILIGLESINPNWLFVVSAAVIPLIIGVVLGFAYQYIKIANKELMLPIWLAIFIFTFCFSFFVPTPFNIPAIAMILVILLVFIIEFIRLNKKKKLKLHKSNLIIEELKILDNSLELKNTTKNHKHFNKDNK